MKKHVNPPILLAILATLSACGTLTPNSQSSTNGFPHEGLLWDSSEVSVCWETSANGYEAEKEIVRESVQSQFNDRTPLSLVGFEACPSKFSRFDGIRIGVEDSGPHTKGLGRLLKGRVNGMVLNFEFKNWSQTCQNRREECIGNIAVHEFGHAIGLAHEHNREDTPDTCTEDRQGTDGTVHIGFWDEESVMNYCNPKHANNGILSQGDVTTVNAIYRRFVKV